MAGSVFREDPFGKLMQHRQLLSLLSAMEPQQKPQTSCRAGRGSAEAAEKLYREHASMKIHLFNLQQCLTDQHSWTTNVTALREEIAGHARQEEEEELPRVRALRDARKWSRLNRNIRQEEALIL
jgi:hypothetical protein